MLHQMKSPLPLRQSLWIISLLREQLHMDPQSKMIKRESSQATMLKTITPNSLIEEVAQRTKGGISTTRRTHQKEIRKSLRDRWARTVTVTRWVRQKSISIIRAIDESSARNGHLLKRIGAMQASSKSKIVIENRTKMTKSTVALRVEMEIVRTREILKRTSLMIVTSEWLTKVLSIILI